MFPIVSQEGCGGIWNCTPRASQGSVCRLAFFYAQHGLPYRASGDRLYGSNDFLSGDCDNGCAVTSPTS